MGRRIGVGVGVGGKDGVRWEIGKLLDERCQWTVFGRVVKSTSTQYQTDSTTRPIGIY